VAYGADSLIKACVPLFPAISRATSVHTPTQSDHFMLFSFMKSSTILKRSFALSLLYIGLQQSVSSLIVVPSTYRTYAIAWPVPLQSVASSNSTEEHLFLYSSISCLSNFSDISVISRETALFGRDIPYYEATEHICHRTLYLSRQRVSQFQRSCAASCPVLFCMIRC
jgi:hypothetical protein